MTQKEMIALRTRVTETLREMVAKENEYLKQQNADLKNLLDYIADETHPKKWKKAIEDMLDPEIAKEDAMWKEFMRIHGTPKKKED